MQTGLHHTVTPWIPPQALKATGIPTDTTAVLSQCLKKATSTEVSLAANAEVQPS